MSIYEFNPEDAERFARDLGIQFKKRGDELALKQCPYCHGGGKDKDTFSINLKTGQFKCLRASCNASGNMITLSHDFGFSLGRDADEYYRHVTRYRRIRTRGKNKPTPKPFAIQFLEGRGIPEAITQQYHITTREDRQNVLAFPFYDENSVLTFIKYRNTDPEAIEKRGKEYSEKDCKPILFGMDQCDPEKSKTLVLTEGQIDSLSVAAAGIPNAVSVPNGALGFTWVPYCWDFLEKFDTLIVFGDHEKGKITLLEQMKDRFHGNVKHVREEDYLECKDANDLLRAHGADAVRKAVENAVHVPDRHIVCLKDVKRKNISEMEWFSTGIGTLDRVLRGFFMGQLILLTGNAGDGKSTLASQFATFALNAGHSVFFYSGELEDYMFRDWVDMQMAGPGGTNGIDGRNGTYWHVKAEIIPKIEAAYEDRFFLYDKDIVHDGEGENETLLETMDIAVKQYGCRVLFIDNLMTAMQDDLNTDIYREQSNFVKELAKRAKRYDILIVLIAHPRKSNGMNFNNDAVAGSSNITNLPDVVLRYARPNPEKSQADRILEVTKNRLTGKLTGDKPIELYYDDGSKRIAERSRFGWSLKWEEEDFTPADEEEEVPFDIDEEQRH